MEHDKELRAIAALHNRSFYVPHYQRGYRWGRREVEAFLQDVWDFAQMEKRSDFYCLQPVVVKNDGDKYNVIDGQQRITTVFLVVKFLQNRNYFTITYQSRPKSTSFLQNIQQYNVEQDIENIDFYYFIEAYEIIKQFFENQIIDKKKFEDILLYKCKILWYEIDKKENENEVFIRLNIGKIPLAESENIKALFLSKNEEFDEDDLKERAELWYKSEIGLREGNDFRYCVLNMVDEKKDIENKILKDDILRIEAYLRAIVPYSNQKHYLFDYFYKCYKDRTLNERWEELEEAINTLSGFASGKGNNKVDREIFHYLGFLILSGENIYSLYKDWLKDKNKVLFSKKLFFKIQNKFSEIIRDIEYLTYTETKDRTKLKEVLLLFNLEDLIFDESSNEYFKFHRFVLEQWSLEHIYAQNSRSIKEAIKNKNENTILEWLQEILSCTDDAALKKEIGQCVGERDFTQDLFDRIDMNFKNNDTLHTIQNLTLLDKDSNSKIGNQIFSKKRESIQRLAGCGRLIPICTRKVFDKVFSEVRSNPDLFEQKDQECYLAAIKRSLQKYVKDSK